jgi:pantetheine-phosphate adenylyltransferase
MSKALYALSADPITFGHINIIERAARTFDTVIIAIGNNPEKSYTFSLAERVQMAQRSLSRLRNVHVTSFHGLLIDFAYENNIDVIVRGVRDANDFHYENILHQANSSQNLGIDTYVLFANPELAHISSSIVKAMQIEHAFIHEYVPLYVKECLESRLCNQHIISITGEIGSGKSYIGNEFVRLGKQKSIEVHNIELDQIAHDILSTLNEPVYVSTRKKISSRFGKHLIQQDGSIDRKVLGEIVFNDQSALEELNRIMENPLHVRLRKELQRKDGLIVVNAALIAETGMSYISNNNTLLVYVDKNTQESRLLSRGLTSEQIKRRLQSQYNYSKKRQKLEENIQRSNHGTIWTIDNSGKKDEIETTFEDILAHFGI